MPKWQSLCLFCCLDDGVFWISVHCSYGAPFAWSVDCAVMRVPNWQHSQEGGVGWPLIHAS